MTQTWAAYSALLCGTTRLPYCCHGYERRVCFARLNRPSGNWIGKLCGEFVAQGPQLLHDVWAQVHSVNDLLVAAEPFDLPRHVDPAV
jgi:hypothetical protein